jgi:hypothetical protein
LRTSTAVSVLSIGAAYSYYYCSILLHASDRIVSIESSCQQGVFIKASFQKLIIRENMKWFENHWICLRDWRTGYVSDSTVLSMNRFERSERTGYLLSIGLNGLNGGASVDCAGCVPANVQRVRIGYHLTVQIQGVRTSARPTSLNSSAQRGLFRLKCISIQNSSATIEYPSTCIWERFE